MVFFKWSLVQMRIVVFVDVQTCLTREFCVFIHMYSVCMCVCVCVCVVSRHRAL